LGILKDKYIDQRKEEKFPRRKIPETIKFISYGRLEYFPFN